MFERLRGAEQDAIKDLGVKQAPFVVLDRRGDAERAGRDFVRHQLRRKRRLLKGTAYRQRIAEALFNAIRKYSDVAEERRRRAQ